MAAVRDLTAIWVWYADQGGTEIADRFYEAVEQTLESVARSPEIGVRVESRVKALAGMRRIAVGGGFGKHLLFYVSTEKRIELVRVAHGMRDLETLGFVKL